jgi:L-asparaginase II
MDNIPPDNPVLAQVVRSGLAESWHRGAVVVVGPDGSVLQGGPVLQGDAGLEGGAELQTGTVPMRAGAVDVPIFPRSSNKPMQAAAMLSCGLGLDGKLLALAAASHSGEDFHVAGVREILARVGLGEDALQCPPALPMDVEAQHSLLRAGGGPARVYMNCSGKHAAMLAACVAAGWPTASYTEPGHPLQVGIRRAVERLTGEPVAATGVDGCGAPLFAISLTGLARAFSALVLADPVTPERRVADAMRAYPEWMSGTRRGECTLMERAPGLLMKSGAEGVMAFALGDGRAAAFKIDDGDGARRAVIPVAIALLRVLGVTGMPAELASTPVLGGGKPVGEVRAQLPF